MTTDLQGKIVVVTGGANGIGRVICTNFVGGGAVVALLDIDKQGGETTERVLRERGAETHFIPTDVSDELQVKSAIADIEERYGSIDVLVNNAATAALGSILDHNPATWDRILAVNLRSVYLCSRSVVPSMLANGSGAIVNIGSAHSYIARHRYAAYTASKFAVLGLTKAMALDHAPSIRVNAVLPGAVDTQGFRREIKQLSDPAEYEAQLRVRYPLGRIARPEDVADCVLFLASNQAASITGAAVPVDCGLTATV